MLYEVEYTDEFETWWDRLTVPEQEDVRPVVRLLEERGTRLGVKRHAELTPWRH